MADLLAKRIPATGHSSEYYKDFHAKWDIERDDSENVYAEATPEQNAAACDRWELRLRGHLGRLIAVEEMLLSPVFKMFEQNVLETIRDMEQKQIWEAIDSGNTAEIHRVAVEHKGILAFFDVIDPIQQKIKLMQIELKACQETRAKYATR
jgi:hypothetical protein